MPFCPVCRSAGKTEVEYTSHYVRASRETDAAVTCPLLLARACHTCGEKGHTPKYCPQEKEMRARQTIPKHIGVPVYKREKGQKILIDMVEASEESVAKTASNGGEGKKVRLLIDDVEVAAEAPKEEVELSLSVERKHMIAAKKASITHVNKFASLADSSDSEEEEDEPTQSYSKTPAKTWAKLATPSAPMKKPRLERQLTLGAPKKLDFPVLPVGTQRSKPKGVWGKKALIDAVTEKHGSLNAWQKMPEKSMDDVLMQRKREMAVEMEAMRRERDAMAKEIEEMRKTYKKVASEVATQSEEAPEKEEAVSASTSDLTKFLKKYEGVSWADMMDEDEGMNWGDMSDSSAW